MRGKGREEEYNGRDGRREGEERDRVKREGGFPNLKSPQTSLVLN